MIYPIIWGAVCRTVVDNVTVQAITGRGSVTELPQKWLHPEDTAPSTPAHFAPNNIGLLILSPYISNPYSFHEYYDDES